MSKVGGKNGSNKKNTQRANDNPKKTTKTSLWVPFCIGAALAVIPSLILAIVSAIPGANDTCHLSSSPCMRLYILSIVFTPIILYGISLAVTSLCHVIINLKKGKHLETHPFLWSLVVFAVFGLAMYLIMTQVVYK